MKLLYEISSPVTVDIDHNEMEEGRYTAHFVTKQLCYQKCIDTLCGTDQKLI